MADASPTSIDTSRGDRQPATTSLGLVERVAALHRVDLFAGVPGRVLAAVAEAATEVEAAPGDVLIEEGTVEAHLFAVVRGRVRVHRGDRTLVELGPCTTVGELAALVPQPRTASVTTLEPTLALRLDKAVLDDLLADWPELAHGVIEALVARLGAIAEHADRAR
jgi:CRP-like cAMP-binding protein